MKATGLYDEFRFTHEYYGDLTHGTPEFLPWHRWFLYNFEKALQKVTGKCIYVPYWDWERDADHESTSPVFDSETFGSYGGVMEGNNCTIDGIVNSETTLFRYASYFEEGLTSTCLQRDFNEHIPFSGEAQVLGLITNTERYANDDVEGEDGFRNILESTPHANVHVRIGGHMRTNASPDDPLFCKYGNIVATC